MVDFGQEARKMAGQVQVNKTSLVFLIIGLGMLVYFIYNALPSWRSYHVNHSGTWKSERFVSIPQNILDLQGNIKILTKEIQFEVGDISVSSAQYTINFFEIFFFRKYIGQN